MLQSKYQGRLVLRLQAENILTITENETIWLLFLWFESSTWVFVIFQFSLVFLCCIRRFRSQNLLAFVYRTSILFCVFRIKGTSPISCETESFKLPLLKAQIPEGWYDGPVDQDAQNCHIFVAICCFCFLSWTTFEFHVFNVSFQAINRKVTIFQLGHLYLIPTQCELVIVTCHHQLLTLLSNLFGVGFRWFYFSNHPCLEQCSCIPQFYHVGFNYFSGMDH